MSSSAHTWKVADSDLVIDVKSSRPNVFAPHLRLLTVPQGVELTPTINGGVYTYKINGAQVAEVKTPKATLLLTTFHVKPDGAATDEYGFVYRVLQGGNLPPVHDADGAPVVSSGGWVEVGPETFGGQNPKAMVLQIEFED